ncbi:hypothetical protein [Tropicimonas sp. S265A]|uniref:hypothetical protein n=1 Tax=Tropicimonas sp. S265A TaxID=3415134 RepID=UPI003C7B0C70
MDSYAIWAVVLGAAVLLFEAHKEYSSADAVDNLKSNNQPTRKELENVRMTALTTEAENRRGRMIYMMAFVALYLILLASPELIPILVPENAGPADAVAGGADHIVRSIVNPSLEGESASPLDQPDSLPFWLAVSIVIGAASPTFQFLERKVRSIAYFFAGVPRNIFRVIKALESLNYNDFGDDSQMSLFKAFTEKLTSSPPDPILGNTTEAIKSSLRCIDLLQGPIIGPQRAAFRELFNDEAPLARIEELSARYGSIRSSIRDSELKDEAMAKLLEDSVALAGSMQCLFGLFAIRSRGTPDALRGTPAAEIIKKVTESKTAQSLHDIALASVVGAVVSYLAFERLAWLLRDPSAQSTFNELQNACADMLWPLLPSLVLLSVVTITTRHYKIDQGDWVPPVLGHIPFWDYAKLAWIPAVLATLLYGLITCLRTEAVFAHLMLLEFTEMTEVSVSFLKEELAQFPRILLMSFFAACAMLFIADHHDNMRWYATVAASVIATIFLWMVAQFSASLAKMPPPTWAGLTLDDMAILITLPFGTFLVLYASTSELAESGSMTKVFSSVADVVTFNRSQS